MSDIPQILVEHFEDPYHRGQCDCSTHAAELVCQETNCQIRFELMLAEDGLIQEAWFDARGCAFCEGLASLACERLEGMSGNEDAVNQVFSDLSELPPERPACQGLPQLTICKALASPLSDLDDDLADGTQFGGPSLREEC